MCEPSVFDEPDGMQCGKLYEEEISGIQEVGLQGHQRGKKGHFQVFKINDLVEARARNRNGIHVHEAKRQRKRARRRHSATGSQSPFNTPLVHENALRRSGSGKGARKAYASVVDPPRDKGSPPSTAVGNGHYSVCQHAAHVRSDIDFSPIFD